MSKKYELTDETMEYNGETLHRIRALKEFETNRLNLHHIVHEGELGGWIKSKKNLSQDGSSWVSDNAIVTGNAQVKGNGIVSEFAVISGNAMIRENGSVGCHAHVFGDAYISGNAHVSQRCQIFDRACISEESIVRGSAHVYGNAHIKGSAKISGNTWVYGNAIIDNSSQISDNACICGRSIISSEADISGNAIICGSVFIDVPCEIQKDAFIKNDEDYLFIGPMGSRVEFTTFYKSKYNEIMVKCGCFNGNINAFRTAVVDTHGEHPKHLEPYLLAANLAAMMLK